MNKSERKKTKRLYIGNVPIGDGAAVAVQSMTKTDTRDIKKTVRQIKQLELAGCEIIRVAVPDMEAARALGEIKRKIKIPLIADIHFNYMLALEAIFQGVDGLRINPGNIGAKWKVKEVVNAAKDKKVPIRIGVNAGSLPKDLLQKYGDPTAQAMVEAAERHIEILEELDFHDIKVSLKASDVLKTVEAYNLFSNKHDYPLHVGITETGPIPEGVVKSAIGIGMLLLEGIGDTVRVSLTDSPVIEVNVAYEILRVTGLREYGVEIISCPTCGRCEVDIKKMVKQVKNALKNIKKPLKVAVMGCAVNGPGEAREADYGIAGGRAQGIVFVKGKIVKTVKESEVVKALLDEIKP
ncbi:flavodoxin-dependent (E)-4-hydroxy-3-methylbut-2-enyl-diphosphate synthase [Thermodesulfovibrio thiophilus]|uniref:flavodoxin-dependent (E)-4-hydroxy-3-methylbut-2-enyl-diphosphate synthase n=1 Tax=Thermodesulfovibrio thiophilus TaxID=340095 RepID=UPI0017D8E895|nr:flavodoxin-dependent (E)-4-hydroxy-3-methylbut-2-enyl-diphosphate synthase [Thermodesulfovibrio thiophilus]HHW20499.1 flavodoxin-dependent (E)-4-hydroxy-3-methylbut-2-enyl-diphosphate synthase [Thermodesulfovibrio thiophilus]